MKTIRVGVVGTGSMGMNHVRVYSELEGCELAAVYDANPAAAEAAGKKFRAPVAKTLEEFADLVDAATICTPTVTHYEIGKLLLARKKHLLVEKPIADNPVHARELAALAQEQGCVLQVGHIERFNPALQALESKLKNPRFLEVTRLSPFPNRSMDIGVVLDVMIHDIEIILHLVRSPIASMDCVGVSVLSKGEDIANVRFRFENGCVANVTASRISMDKLRKIRVFQEDAYLSLDYQKQDGVIYRVEDGKIVREGVAVIKGEPLKNQLESFVACARDGLQPKVSGQAAAAALDIALEITRQIEAADPREKKDRPMPQMPSILSLLRPSK
jgi:predicted dehydrogenase